MEKVSIWWKDGVMEQLTVIKLQEMRDRLAEFMEWDKRVQEDHAVDFPGVVVRRKVGWCDYEQTMIVEDHKWLPDKNIEQAMMIFDKFVEMGNWPMLFYNADGWTASFTKGSDATDASKTMAICVAAIKTLEAKVD